MINCKATKYVDGRIMKSQPKREKHLNSQWGNCLNIEFLKSIFDFFFINCLKDLN